MEGQVALVLGGASGMGLATTILLLRAGLYVAIGDASHFAEEDTVKNLTEEYGSDRVMFHSVNVTDEESYEVAFSHTKKHYKRLDVFINCENLLLDSEWRYEVDVNLKGVIQGTLFAWKYMGKNEGGAGGVVVNIASIFGFVPSGGIPIYVATKYGVVGWGRSSGDPFNTERTGVRVLTLCPGITGKRLIANQDRLIELTPDHAKEIEREIGTWKVQPNEDVANAIIHIIHYGNSGSVWVVNSSDPLYEVNFPDVWTLKKQQNGVQEDS